ncbi:MAG: agmatine deiminase family protein [Saprospiraceae bacterium]|nr:agmatine deiminase family protein [Saprospiraceae bacterium]
MRNRVLPAEWYEQSMVQLTFPHADTDWADVLEEAIACFVTIAEAIAARQKVLVVCADTAMVAGLLGNCPSENLVLINLPSNDTWARDHAAITVLEDGVPTWLDFKFNGWGLKFAADKDNLLTQQLVQKGMLSAPIRYENHLNFVLEGGSMESDGMGTILTTAACLLSPNRNGGYSRAEIEIYLQNAFGAKRLLWLHDGYLAGDDTDSHIDTLARFCDERTIAYVKCDDPSDEHFEALQKNGNGIETFRTLEGLPYRLVALPMAIPMYENGHRLPATYANFLIINGAVLLPFYNSPRDAEAKQVLENIFPDREIIGIDCSVLVKQHGSLHCVTMQYPKEVIV